MKKKKTTSHSRVGKKETARTVLPTYRILIIDDEIAIQDSLKEILARKGNAVDTAGTGIEAVRMINGSAYDIIICDMKLPDMSTFELYRQVKERESALTRTIFISGSTRTEMVHETFNMPRVHYLTKPFPPADLYDKIAEISATYSPPHNPHS